MSEMNKPQVRQARFCRTCGVALPRNRTAYCYECRPQGWIGGNAGDVDPLSRRKTCQLCGKRLLPVEMAATEGEEDGDLGSGRPSAGTKEESSTGDGRRFCGRCLLVYQETVRRVCEETGRIPKLEALTRSGLEGLRRQTARKIRLSGDMIAAIAQTYDRPYDSYGKLRAYIDENDRLPDERFLKSERKHPVVETVRGME